MATTALEVFDDLIALIVERQPEYEGFHEYWRGEQDLPIKNSEFRSRFGTLFSNFRDNLARPIVEIAETRVRIREWGDGQGLGADAMKIWKRNRMSVESKWVHQEAMVKGDGYVIVLPTEDGPAGIWPQITESCAIVYSKINPREKIAGIKWWIEDMLPPEGSLSTQPYCRMNFYFDDRIERYVSTTQGDTLVVDFEKMRPYEDEGGFTTKHKVGEVPMFQFAPGYDITIGKGRSDLADAKGLIDAINKEFLDMLVSSEYTAAPQRWATGVEIPLDPKTGEPMEAYKAGSNRLWTAPNEQARFGQFAGGDMSSYVAAIQTMVDHLAFTTRTPIYALTKEANWPSGEMLKSAEGPLRQRVQDHQDEFGMVWLEVMMAALRVDNVETPEDLLDELEPRWLPPNAPFATIEFMEELKVKAEVAGVPEEMLWRELGYNAKQIEEMKAMREAQAALGVDVLALEQSNSIAAGAPPATTTGGLATDVLPSATGASPLTNL